VLNIPLPGRGGGATQTLGNVASLKYSQLPAIVKELIGSGVTVLVTAGTLATLAAKRASANLPIVLVGVDDPVALGIVDSLGQPGSNATGLCLTSSEVIGERLDLLRELAPAAALFAVVLNPGTINEGRRDALRRATRPRPCGRCRARPGAQGGRAGNPAARS